MEARNGRGSASALTTGTGPWRLQPQPGDALPWVWSAARMVTSVAFAQLAPGLMFVAVSRDQPVNGILCCLTPAGDAFWCSVQGLPESLQVPVVWVWRSSGWGTA